MLLANFSKLSRKLNLNPDVCNYGIILHEQKCKNKERKKEKKNLNLPYLFFFSNMLPKTHTFFLFGLSFRGDVTKIYG